MKRLVSVAFLLSVWPLCQAQSQTFAGTNAPAQATNFVCTVATGATNLSLVISNNASAWSYLFLKKGGDPTDVDFDFVARLQGRTNELNLETPEFVVTNYGLRVTTPATSGAHAFQVLLTTNRTDLRSAAYPVLKPLVFSVDGALTNTGSGSWNYFQVDMPSNLLTGWRLVLSSTNTVTPDLYLRRNLLPTTSGYDKRSTGNAVETVILTSAEATNSTYFIGVYQPSGAASSANYTLSTELASITTLSWDPGTTDPGTQVYTNQSVTGGDYFFAITTLGTANGVWRTALNVQSGEADLYLQYGALPSASSYRVSSTRVGSDGFVLSQLGNQFAAGQNWYLLVRATPGAQWNVVTGEAYVQSLPALAPDASSSAAVVMGAEGIRYFRTTISLGTLAWRLSVNGLSNQIYVKKTTAPHPYNTSTYDLTQAGQMLIVPTYLSLGDQYFVGVVGPPGLAFTLDSRQQEVREVAFNSATNFSVTTYGYTTFRVQVPVQQIAWQLVATPTAGDVNVAVRRDAVPNEFVNDAFSDVAGITPDSVTLVPPALSDGTFYVTVYGIAPYSCSLTNGNPVITDVDYVFQITNDAPSRVGWRFYRVPNTAQQLGTLGWELDLASQPPGTEIAIRRNAVPSRWNYRTQPSYISQSTLGYVDQSSLLGFLQEPNHQADIWYIGVYSPTSPLGSFVLTGSQLTGQPISYDGEGSSANVVAQPVGKLQFFRLDVPVGALGWDIRITNVTSGDPRLVVCRNQLPEDLSSRTSSGGYWYANSSATWPSGYQWAAGYDWTGYTYGPNGTNEYGHLLQMGMANPLEPGTYFVGVLNGTGSGYLNPMSYTLVSRGIGPGLSIPVNDLAFTNGTVSHPGLPAREAAYYRVVVPTNLPSWNVRLGTNTGDSLLMLQKDVIPNVGAGGSAPNYLYGGRKLDKAGNEHYLFLPNSGQSNIVAGTYFLAAASDGMNPHSSYIGTNSSSFNLTSFGTLSVSNLGTMDPTGATDLLQSDTNEGGESKAFRFTVPPGTLAIEVHLDNRVGNPYMTLRADDRLPVPYDSYGNDGGQSAAWQNSTLINIANPTATNYTLMVQATYLSGTYPDASYTIRLHAIGPQPLTFDGGSNTISGQPSGTWQYFTLTVPPGALGWDLRLTNVTSGDPRLVVARDVAPTDLGSHTASGGYWYANSSATWPSGYQWAAGYDWTGYTYGPNGTNEYGHLLQMGMANPLEPGTYFVGVLNGTGSGYLNPMSYTLVSRGIGPGLSIPVNDLAFTNGTVSHPGLPAREAAYYRVVVPTNLPSWNVRLGTNTGDSLLMLQKDVIPNVGAGGSAPNYLYGGRKLDKAGNEHYLFLPNSGQSNIVAGTYFLAAASDGMNPHSSYIGTNSSSFNLTSFGTLPITSLGPVDFTGATDILVTNSLEGGACNAYQFSVPAGTLSLEVHLDNRVGNPYMTLRADGQLPAPYDGYGNDGGQSATWQNSTLINIANPTATNYTLMVQASYVSSAYPDASYTIRLHAIGPQPLAFDGGSNTISGQLSGTWQYFTLTVPPGALGWDLRITNVTSGDPRLVVARDLAPKDLGTHSPSGGYWYANSSATWPSGYQWAAGYDWTGYTYGPNGTNEYGHLLQMGMGNPLEPGTYFVGVLNGTGSGYLNPMSYTLVSRGIGPGLSIPVTDLAFTNGIASQPGLPAREAAYYRVVVPTNLPSWKLRLTATSGESLLALQKDALPNVGASSYAPTYLYGGRKLQKSGNEQYLFLPSGAVSNIAAGTYFLLVASEGMNPRSSYAGTNVSAYTLTSYGALERTNLGTVGATDLVRSNALQGGEAVLYQFTILPSTSAVELRLEDRAGNPYATLVTGPYNPNPHDSYGNDGGVSYSWYSPTIITLPNAVATNYSLTLQADYLSGFYPDANCTLRVRQMPTPLLNFAANLNTNGYSNVASGTLADGQSAFFQVTVPATNDGQAVLGWRLNLTQTAGSPKVRVRPGLLPDDYNYYNGTSPFATGEAIIAPPYLAPGVWYVEVRGQGITSFTLTSSDVQLYQPAWTMPVVGDMVTTPGLPPGGPLFGDSGVDAAGIARPGDQGIDLEQGSFHFYAISVSPTNIGLLRTRLDAISGDPNLYIRVGAVPTLNHNATGQSGSLIERSLTANVGSEYGNWVPLNGRYDHFLTPGTWFLAVKAAGNSNVRYRLRVYTGIVNDLALDGGSYTNQILAGGDWMYYRVQIPTNAPVNWNVTFAEQLGNVIMSVRDTVPPGQASTPSDLRDWSDDAKNHGPYLAFDAPGTYALVTPPVRPGTTYFLGFRAVIDTTFAVGCNTNGGAIDYTNVVPFYAGNLVTTVPALSALRLRIDVPAEARRLILNFTNSTAVNVYLDQGSVPTRTTSDHWYRQGTANPVLNQALYSANGWPWLPGYMYFLYVTNTSASPQSFALNVDGRNCATDDYDSDTLPDCWELTYWPSIYSYGPNSDPDGDGVRNWDEYLEGTDPTDSLSFHPRLVVNAQYGTVNRNPAGNPTSTPPSIWYNLGQALQLTAVPDSDYGFLSWSGDASGSVNPLSITMDAHKTITAVFGLTKAPNADYQFQLNLHSSVGTPPDLTNIAGGNIFVTDTVDGASRTVYRFPQASGVAMAPADGVIPTNVYTMVLLFSLDNVSGWRRLLDCKNPASNNGLYVNGGRLNFYPVAGGSTATIAASNYVQVVLTRDASSNVVGYVNGVQQFSFLDSQNYAVLGGSPQILRFFKDDGAENSSGAVARIRLYDKVMPPAQVALLDRLPGGVSRPRFLAPFLDGTGLNLPAEVVAGLSYRLQGSTNLIDWFDLSTNTAPANPYTFTDPLGPVYPSRFYRLVTP